MATQAEYYTASEPTITHSLATSPNGSQDDLERGSKMIMVQYKVELQNSQTREDIDGTQYTVYVCKVQNLVTDEIGYIWKRYSEFYDLYSKLLSKFSSIASDVTFPPSSWFFKLSDSVIQQRKTVTFFFQNQQK